VKEIDDHVGKPAFVGLAAGFRGIADTGTNLGI
jgi:hypothetical protein